MKNFEDCDKDKKEDKQVSYKPHEVGKKEYYNFKLTNMCENKSLVDKYTNENIKNNDNRETEDILTSVELFDNKAGNENNKNTNTIQVGNNRSVTITNDNRSEYNDTKVNVVEESIKDVACKNNECTKREVSEDDVSTASCDSEYANFDFSDCEYEENFRDRTALFIRKGTYGNDKHYIKHVPTYLIIRMFKFAIIDIRYLLTKDTLPPGEVKLFNKLIDKMRRTYRRMSDEDKGEIIRRVHNSLYDADFWCYETLDFIERYVLRQKRHKK